MVVGQFSQDVDILVIGGGPAGYTAAFRAAELGKTVAIVDPNETLGGECLHHACIPSKSAVFGVDSTQAIATISKGVEHRCTSLGIERLHGLVHFENVKTAQVTGEVVSVIKFRKAIIASGSQQRTHNEYSETMQVESIYSEVPSQKNLLIVGNTPSAIEAATFLSNTNNVSLWAEGNILSTFARGLVKLVERKLSKCVTICKEKLGAEDFDHVILAGHRPPHTSSLQLEHAKVSCIDGFITIDDTCQTTNPKMYAVGECVGCQHSVALAISQARVAAESACGLDSHVDSTWIPQVAWSTPEIAQVGELDSNETISVKWGNSGLAVTLGCQDGVTMLAFDKESHAILGVGIVGTGATEMISEGVLALEMGATLYDLATVVRPHPTRSEMLSEAARIALTSL